MELLLRIFSIILLCLSLTEEKATNSRLKRDTHIPPLEAPTFRRDSVEYVPEIDHHAGKSASLIKLEEFGSRSLPLRSSVESIPDVYENSVRIPLRDAVEKRPPPDEAIDYKNLGLRTDAALPYGFDLQEQLENFYAPYKYFEYQVQDYKRFKPQPVSYPYQQDNSKVTPSGSTNSPNQQSNRFPSYNGISNAYQQVSSRFPSYNVYNPYQQLMISPFGRSSRALTYGQDFFRFIDENKKLEDLEGNDKKIVCYIEGIAGYRKEPLTFNPEDLDPYICTHVIYAYATIDPINFQMVPNDQNYDVVQGGYRAVVGLKNQNPHLKVLISLGGSREDGSHRFSSMVSSARKRRGFIRSAITFIKQYGFDGMEIHWEYPGAEELGGQVTDKEQLNQFLEELNEIFKPNGWLLAISAPASRFRTEDGFTPSKLGTTVDFVTVQAYDFHAERDPVADHPANLYARPRDTGLNMFLSVDYSVRFWLRQGLPSDKLILGIPTFGRTFTLQYYNETEPGALIKGPGREGFYTQTPGLLAYYEICELILNEGAFKREDEVGSPYVVNGDQWVGYDDPESIRKKVQYVKELKLGGIGAFAADLDDFKGLCGERWPLLLAIHKELRGNKPPAVIQENKGAPTKPFSKCQQNGYYSDPKNCAAYYICKNGLNYHLSCGNNLMFNPLNGKCDHVNPQKCRPGEQVYLPSNLKDVEVNFRSDEIKEKIKDNRPKVVCYVTSWGFYRKGEGKFVPEHIDQRLCTHVVYAFASLDAEKLIMKEFDPWADLDNNLYQRMTSLRDTTVLLSLGGWTDSAGDKYSRLVSDGSARRRFVVSAISFLRKHGFGGLHFDWNYPTCWQSNCKRGPSSDKPNFSKLMQELRKEFDKQSPPLVLAAAISGYKEVIEVAYDLPNLGSTLDFLSVMSYDYHGAWETQTGHVSPLYVRPDDKYPQYNVNYTMQYLISLGAPKEKLLVGVPLYGQSFTLAQKSANAVNSPSTGPGQPGEYTKQPGMLAYYEICNRVKNHRWIVSKNDKPSGVSAYKGDQWVGYEDVDTIREKAMYIKNNGFGGAVAWTIDLDDFTNQCCEGTFPLLRSLSSELGIISEKPTKGDCTKPPTPSTPAPPQTTTGIDTGASSTEGPWTSTTTRKTTTAPWWTPSATTKPTKKPSTTTMSWWTSTIPTTTSKKPITTTPWWATPSTTEKPPSLPWWTTTATKPTTSKTTTKRPVTTTTTTRKPTTTPIVWWTETPKPVQTGGTIIPPPAVIMPELDKPVMNCEPGQYLPDPSNCNVFYRCVLGELKKQYCAGGLHWNKEKNICDWPSEANCENAKPTRPSNRPTTTSWQKPTKLTTTRRPTTTTTRTTTQAIPEETEAASADIQESCMIGAYYPHADCNHFYVCFNDQLVAQSCAPGLMYNVEQHMCDWSFKVKCGNRKKIASRYTIMHRAAVQLKTKAQPYSSCEGNAFAPMPGDCNRYMHCQWGKYEIRQCAIGLHWNREKKLCDWPKDAKCKEDESNAIPGSHNPSDEVDVILSDELPPSKPPSTTVPPSTSSYPEWSPATTQSSGGSEWEWHPPIPPTSEKPPLSEPLKPLSGYFKIVCYFTNWAWYRQGVGKYLPEDIDENLCTHIVYGFAVLDFSNLIIKAHDSWADFDNQFYKRVTAYKAKGVKVSVAIGGWNDSQGDKYSRLVNNPAARRKFIENILKFLDKHNFDGLDLDWEYPKCWQVDCKKGPDSDKPAFAAFVRELREAFNPRGYLLSAAVSPSKLVIDAGYDVPALAQSLDWVAVMTYDFHGQWDKQTGHVAPLFYHPDDEVTYFNANFSINYWISEGVPRRNIVMGMPLYGQSFRLETESENGLNAKAPGPGEAGEYTRAAGFLAYYEICDNIKNKGWTVVQDPHKALGPYAYKGNQWVSFDDKHMIRKKSEYIRKMDLGGGMIWALDLDDFKNRCGEGRHPLLTIIRNVLADPGTGQQEQIIIEEDEHPAAPAPGPPEPVVTEEGSHEITQESSKPIVPEESSQELSQEVSKPMVTHPIVPPSQTISEPLVDANSEFKVVCYFTNWAWYRQGVGKYLPADIDPDLCTHIIYGFAVLNGDQLVIKPHDTWADFDNKFYEKVTAFKAKGIKVLVAIGGWNDSAGDKYSKLVNSPPARRRFVAHVVDFIEENNFDGLDLDWEYPKCWQVDCNKGPHSDKPAFAELVKELKEAFEPKGWLLSAAVSPSKRVIDAGYDVPTLSKYLDWIAVMCYDYHGQWDKITGHVAPMYPHPEDIDETFNTNFTINYWIEQGADRRKLVMGMPMYGQSFSLADNNENGLNVATYGGGEAGEETRARGFLAYYEICTNVIKKGWQVVRDRKGRIGPYAYLRDQWVSFDDIGMIRHKSEYIRAMGLGGGMIWALDLDDFKNICGCEEYPLLRTINRVLRGYKKPDPKCVLGKNKKPPTTTSRPTMVTYEPSTSTHKATLSYEEVEPSYEIEQPDNTVQGGGAASGSKPCNGQVFMPHETHCNMYYQCNQGELQELTCSQGLFWNEDHCDWPENAQCHPDGSTTAPIEDVTDPPRPIIEEDKPDVHPQVTPTTPKPSYPITSGADDFKVICYFTNWAWYRQGDGKYLPSDIDPELCTHINYGFAVLDSNSLTIKPHDSWADIDNEFYKKVTEFKARGIKVLIALGGWNDSLGDKYSRLVNSPEARARFVTNVIEFIEKWQFDGLDLDWEYPKCWQVDCNKGPKSDKPAFAELVKELSNAFKPRGLLLSSAVSPSKAVIDAGYDVPALNQYFDWIGVMTYDFHGHWDKQTGHVAPLYYYPGDVYDYFNANFSVHYWIEKGANPKKLVMGMPLYGQSFSLADTGDRGLNARSYGPGEAGEFTRAGGFLAFYEVCERVKKRGWTVTRDPEGRIGPYATHGNQWVSYDDISEVRRKSNLVKELGLGGGMIWALDLDDFRNRCGCGKHPLLKTMNHVLRGYSSDISLQNCT